MISRSPRSLLATVGIVAVLMSAACSGGSTHGNGTSPTTSGSTSSSATSSPSTPTSSSAAPAAKNPYTGIGPVPSNPVIAVKIDDTAPGRPQRSIDQADVVYIEAVEGGLTRLAAIFATHLPVVGYVRSTRPSDPDLLLQYGKLTEVYSGGAHDSIPLVHASGITSWSNDAGSPYFFRVSRYQSTYINLAIDLAKVATHTHTNAPHSNGWTFNSSLAGLSATPAFDVRTRVTGSYAYTSGTPVEFRWDGALKAYVRYINGVRQIAADGKPVTATNVIVQSCTVVPHPQDTDVNGNPAQFTYTIGSGKVSVFRQGRRIDGTWSRPSTSAGTTLRTATGAPLPLNPGNTWVILIRTGTPVAG